MLLNELKPTHKNKGKKRIARGGKRGTYSGRGIKGQKSRAGAKIRPAIRDFIKTIPKLRGRGSHAFKSIKVSPTIVNLDAIVKKFESGSVINPESLIKKGLISYKKGKIPAVKILSKGEFNKKLTFENCLISKKAKEQIEKSGGNIKEKEESKTKNIKIKK